MKPGAQLGPPQMPACCTKLSCALAGTELTAANANTANVAGITPVKRFPNFIACLLRAAKALKKFPAVVRDRSSHLRTAHI
jgi:hypothetical protein